jgi:exodeoxyribonuclease V alpha subunit
MSDLLRAPIAAPADFATALAVGFARRIGTLAERLGADASSVRWARRAAFAASRTTQAGHVCLPLARLAHRYGATLAEVRAALAASRIVSDGDDEADALKPLVVDRAARLYLARYFDYERRLGASIVAHARHSDPQLDESALAASLTRYFGPAGGDEIDWQRAAAALALAGRLTVVSGGPGTGKTTTVVGMLACLVDIDPTLSIALAAPTGKAAQRMQEALAARAASLPPGIGERLPARAQTLHRLLGAGQGVRPRYRRDNPLPCDVLVVDEASMIDVAMAAQLFDALAPQTRLILLGDKDQLAAVEAGAVFAELSAAPAFSEAGIARIARATGADPVSVSRALPATGQHAAAIAAMSTEADETAGSLDDDAFLSRDEEMALDWAAPSELPADPYPDYDIHAAAAAARAEPADSAESAAVREADDALPPDGPPLVDCVIWLERNYRFGLDSPVGRLSLAIRRGDVAAALALLSPGEPLSARASAAATLHEDSGTTLAAQTVERLAEGFERYIAALGNALDAATPNPEPLFEALNAYRVLCATRVGARGVDALNTLMSAHVRHAARVPLAPGAAWFAGRPIMIARNDYALGLFNGDIGVTLPGEGGALRVYFRTADGGFRPVSPAALPPCDTAFALTVHKSQGSEFDEAALVLPASASRVLSRELVYTAVTRARVSVSIVGARTVLADAIATAGARDSGLAARMAEAMRAKDNG